MLTPEQRQARRQQMMERRKPLPIVKINNDYEAGKSLQELADAHKVPVGMLIRRLVIANPDLVLRPADEAKRQELRAQRPLRLK